MKCPKCEAKISMMKSFSKKTNLVTCKNCDTQFRVKGDGIAMLAPMLAFFYFHILRLQVASLSQSLYC